MKIKNALKRFLTQLADDTYKACGFADRDALNVTLTCALQKATTTKEILFPLSYVELLRDCVKKQSLSVLEIKKNSNKNKEDLSKNFYSIIDAAKELPQIEFSVAEDIALIADSFLGDTKSVESGNWIGNVGAHFKISSSFAKKGRILSAIIKHAQRRRVLELGTAYGMSALFIMEALKKIGSDVRLTTIEGGEPQFSLASAMLKSKYKELINCEFGWSREVLPRIINKIERVDFLFHDAGHSRGDYISDFNMALPVLMPGAIVLIDDINWSDPRFSKGDPQCYEGWLELADHPRVRRAVEIDSNMGLLLLS